MIASGISVVGVRRVRSESFREGRGPAGEDEGAINNGRRMEDGALGCDGGV